jgi:hypothetical protein
MTHAHHAHRDDDVEIIERDRPFGAGLTVAIAVIVIMALLAFAVLWSRPWSSGSGSRTTPNQPGISDNGGGGSSDQDNSGGGGSAGQPGQ